MQADITHIQKRTFANSHGQKQQCSNANTNSSNLSTASYSNFLFICADFLLGLLLEFPAEWYTWLAQPLGYSRTWVSIQAKELQFSSALELVDVPETCQNVHCDEFS